MSGARRSDFTENLEAVARGVRRLEEIGDPILREAIAAALRLRDRELRLDPASRARMRRIVLTALAPARPTLADRLYTTFAVLGKPAPYLLRGLGVLVVIVGIGAGATVASADSLPADLLYGVKLAGEQVRLAVAVSAEDRASVELSIAEHRLTEAERLAAQGREDDAIIATAAYGSTIADAAADLASVESTDVRAAALVTQLQASLTAGQQRVAATAARLATDPRTANTAEVLDTVSALAAASKDSPATRIADQAAAITAKLAGVASDRVNRLDAHRDEGSRAASSADARATDHAAPTGAPTGAPTVPLAADPTRRPAETADPGDASDADSAVPTATPRRATATPPADPSAARQSAERAREAAARAREAAAKAKRAASRTAGPTPVRR